MPAHSSGINNIGQKSERQGWLHNERLLMIRVLLEIIERIRQSVSDLKNFIFKIIIKKGQKVSFYSLKHMYIRIIDIKKNS
jgi:hypothetical protein